MDTETGKISKCQEIYIKHLKESHLKNHADIRVLYPADPPYTNHVISFCSVNYRVKLYKSKKERRNFKLNEDIC